VFVSPVELRGRGQLDRHPISREGGSGGAVALGEDPGLEVGHLEGTGTGQRDGIVIGVDDRERFAQ
jgi:hypothetical protein